ncbi:MAG TPA: ABC transporter permease, partial [Gemmatimonadaceae bacterium]|nr:ABC transporter permease [Gemmatimonadaceae bacterium]
MKRLSRWYWGARERVRTILFRGRAESEMERELRFHLELEAEKLVRSEGLSAAEARRRAGVAFGGVERFKEEVRDARGLDWLAGMRLDFLLGVRMLIKHPALTFVGGLGMAVAIAVSVGFFAFVETNIYPVLPLDEGDRIVALENRDVEINDEERQSLHDFVAWRSELRSVENLAAFRVTLRNLITRGGPPEPVQVAEMTAAGFRVARVPPLLGRYLVEDDERDGAPAVVVIGYDVWKKRFEGDSTVVGRDIRFGSTVHTVVGVMPDGFKFPMNHQYWTPLRADPTAYARREGPAIFIFGRLAAGVTMDEAQAELTVIGKRTAAAFPQSNAKLRPMVMPYVHSLIDIQGISVWMVVQMQLMMSLLLVVVALNVSVLVYARTAARLGEIAVRTALGASRRRVIAQLFVEALVLSLGAAVVGLTLAQFGVRMGNRLLEMETGVPFWTDYSLRPTTVLFTVLVAFLAAVIVGVLPALQATGKRLQDDLRQLGGGTRMRLGKTWTLLIVAQVAIAVAGLPAAFNMGWTEVRGATTRP